MSRDKRAFGVVLMVTAVSLLMFASTAAANPNDGVLHQINSTHWYFETTQTALADGEYNYQAFANNISSDYRILEVNTAAIPPAPPDPTNLQSTTGNFWVNHSWSAGSGNITDSYNVSVNQTWHNSTLNVYWNNTGLSAHGWSNITVYAWNTSAGGALSSGSISQDTQVPNNAITITNTSDWNGDTGENVYVDYNSIDADSDTPTYSCSRTDLFTDFDTANGTGNWTPAANGTYHIDFGVSDGWGSTSNYTMTIQVGVGGITTETKVPVSIFITLMVLMFCGVIYVFYAKTHISRIFTTLITAWLAFMLSQMIVSGNVVRMVSALNSVDAWSHDTVAIQIPALSYLLLFVGVILSIFLVKFVIDFGLAVLKEARREGM